VPFVDRFPEESYLYRLMSTKFGEEMSRDEVDARIKEIVEGGGAAGNYHGDNFEEGHGYA
jgi:hypothetical protein